ncbi:MAG TPA: DUF5658 family protein [Bryobacteraceae bacterium]|nr:DUF5658 family protein [Bryobacteraceae bacterium]
MRKSFLIFALLQVADLTTTLIVFRMGGVEQNPLVQHLMAAGGAVQGVILAKIIALAVGVTCLVASKHRALSIANLVFAAIVAWNLTIIARLA